MNSEEWAVKKGSMVQKSTSHPLYARSSPPAAARRQPLAARSCQSSPHAASPRLTPPAASISAPPTRAILRDSRFVIHSSHNVERPS